MFDAVAWGEVCSERVTYRLLRQRDESFAFLVACGGPNEYLFQVKGTIIRRVTGPKTSKMAKPPHDSGLNLQVKTNADDYVEGVACGVVASAMG